MASPIYATADSMPFSPTGTGANHALKGIILVGGPSVGTRFRPLSLDCPKPLFPIAGQPMIYHHVSALAKLPGMREILVVGFFENSVFDRFLTEVQLEFPTVPIRYLREYQALGTGGSLFHFRDQIIRGDPDQLFVLNADIATSFPLTDMIKTHAKHGGVATLLANRVDRSLVSKYGCVVADPETKEVLHFVEKPESGLSDLISCGIYLFNREIFDVMRRALQERQAKIADSGYDDSIARGGAEKFMLEQDVLILLTSAKKLYTHICHPTKDFWMQIKTGSSVIPANRMYLQHFLHAAPRKLSNAPKPNLNDLTNLTTGGNTTATVIQPAYIHPTAVLHPTAKLGPNVSIGPRVLLGRGVRVRDAILLDSVEVKNDSCVLNSVVGWDSKIGSWCRVEGAPGESNALNATLKGYKIPSATILGKDVTVHDEIAIRNCIVLPHKDIKTSQHNEILM
ncbi:nucleotide-diphospho-sugar transferase [Fimicolochytrium jonesii]|uniref:nucleotide-diphospho-sugar transferase n=1 Tax=Fimicolochytrium jonesii TaxID=1396493 RepID=UPI0022FF21ED|nr:nucleotide-diphospho-sugar transferase [Fimicolochytrium jonesii]KAI8819210.1 nucleotide-diphospho-sugar transferase [Fimicolochytrium jonesii]